MGKTLPRPLTRIDLSASVDQGKNYDREHLNDGDLTRIRTFLTRCSTQHKACSEATSSYMPTRLIDIHGESDTLYLIETANLEPYVKYVALSYCWGKPKPGLESYKTTASNMADRIRGFSIAEQPPTIQDAIQVARRLEFEYLWVDALCIIQGDIADWEREGLAMDNVYCNSYLTIVPVAANTVWDGFFTRIAIETELSLTSDPAVRPRSIAFHYPFESDVSEGHPWFQRAWTLQERALLTRILYFTRRHIYTECLWGRDVSTIGLPRACRPWRQTHDPWKPWGNGKDYNTVLQDWHALLEQYSSRKLTFPGDKLVAIAGLANHVSSQLSSPDCYHFGIFSGQIHQGLLWTRGEDHRPHRRIPSIPSWSWASYPGKVDFRDEYYRPQWQSDVEYVSCSSRGELVVSAKVFRACTFFPDKDVFGKEMRDLLGEEPFRLDLDGDLLVDDLEVISIASLSSEYTQTSGLGGLLVESGTDRLGNVILDKYRRVGWFWVRYDNIDEDVRNLHRITQPRNITLV